MKYIDVFKKYGAIADGEYTVNYLVPGKSAPLPSNYAVNGGNPVDCLNGINPSPISPYSATQKMGFIFMQPISMGKQVAI